MSNQFKNIADLKTKVAQHFTAYPNQELNVTLNGIRKTYRNEKQFKNWLMECINARINRNEPQKRGRKDDRDFMSSLNKLSRDLKDRVFTLECSVNFLNKEPKIKARVQHRLYTNNDF